jgi:hypothetical protein
MKDRIIIQEIQHEPFYIRVMVILGHGGCDNRIASVIESNRERRLLPQDDLRTDRAGWPLHTADLNRPTRRRSLLIIPKQAEVRQALELLVVCNPSRTVAEANFAAQV